MIPTQNISESVNAQRIEEIVFNKCLRQLLDGCIKDLRARSGSAERTLAFRALQQARHWLGEDLAILGAQHPYPNGNNPANAVVDPPADLANRRNPDKDPVTMPTLGNIVSEPKKEFTSDAHGLQ